MSVTDALTVLRQGKILSLSMLSCNDLTSFVSMCQHASRFGLTQASKNSWSSLRRVDISRTPVMVYTASGECNWTRRDAALLAKPVHLVQVTVAKGAVQHSHDVLKHP